MPAMRMLLGSRRICSSSLRMSAAIRRAAPAAAWRGPSGGLVAGIVFHERDERIFKRGFRPLGAPHARLQLLQAIRRRSRGRGR